MDLGLNQPRFAVLIDADNAQATVIEAILSEVAKHGVTTVKRAYGDWTTTQLTSWKDRLNEHAITPIQQFRYTTGKNATDSALIIDAMDLLYSGKLQGFCLVSSDSDFTRLATRLRETGVTVLGFGKQKTPIPFVRACDKFIYTEILQPEVKSEDTTDSPPPRKGARELRRDTRLVRQLREAIEVCADENGWAHPGQIGAQLLKQSSDFDSRNYGYSRLLQLLQATELFEVRMDADASGKKQHFVRDKRATQ